MGATESKIEGGQEADGTRHLMSTPKEQIRLLEIDPRSPSVDIARTPIEVLKTPLFITNTDVANTVEDPRSPTNDFHRTPIVVNTDKKLPVTLHNKILDNARKPQLVPTPVEVKRPTPLLKTPTSRLSETNTDIKLSENKRNSVVGLLETNIDFLETDLDAVMQTKSLARGETESFEVPLEVSEVLDKSVKLVEDEVICEEFETPLKIVASSYDPLDNNLEVIPVEDDLSNIDALNRKLTNLIFEDKMQRDANSVKSNVIIKHRTPLHEQNPNSPICKSIPVLKVSDKPTKAPRSGSKIPVFKDRTAKGKISVQCENTPPRIKAKKSQWAAEDSMII